MTNPVSSTSIKMFTNARHIDPGPHSKRPGSAPQDNASRLLSALQSNLGSNVDNEAFKTLSEEYENAVSIGRGLKKAADSMQDGMRGEKISRLKQRIERLKEMLKFATPEQARKLIKELKSISKEFKAVAKDLGEAASSLSSIASGAVPTPSANTADAVPVTPGGDASAPPGSTQPADDAGIATGQVLPATPADAKRDVAKPGAAQDDPAAGAAGSQDQTNLVGNPESGEGEPGSQKQQAEAYTAIAAYTAASNEDDKRSSAARAGVLQGQRDTLKELAADIKYVAARLKLLLKQSADADDKEAAKDLKKIDKLLREGERELGHPDLNQGLAHSSSPSPGTASDVPTPTGVSNVATGSYLSATPVAVVSDISV